MSLNELTNEVHQIAVDKGWWPNENPRTVGDLIALMHSELSEALEEHRKGMEPSEWYIHGEEGKPEGVPIELADCIIRILDFCGRFNINIEEAVRVKINYNRKRPQRHGGKTI